MKRALHLGLFSVLLFLTACNKKDDSPNTVPPPVAPPVAPTDPDAMQYTVNGLTDISIRKRDSVLIPLSIVHTGGRQEKLDLSTVDLPSNVTATFQASSGIPAYATTLTLKSNYATPGDYPIKLVATPASGDPKEFEIKLNINNTPNDDCVMYLAGKYSYVAECTGYINEAVLEYEAPNKLKISSFYFYDNLDFIMSCDNKTVEVMKDDPNGVVKHRGSGTMTAGGFTLTIESIDNSGAHKCEFEFTRK